MIEAVVNGLLDEFPIFRRNRVKFLAGLCLVQFLLAIPMVTEVSTLCIKRLQLFDAVSINSVV